MTKVIIYTPLCHDTPQFIGSRGSKIKNGQKQHQQQQHNNTIKGINKIYGVVRQSHAIATIDF